MVASRRSARSHEGRRAQVMRGCSGARRLAHHTAAEELEHRQVGVPRHDDRLLAGPKPRRLRRQSPRLRPGHDTAAAQGLALLQLLLMCRTAAALRLQHLPVSRQGLGGALDLGVDARDASQHLLLRRHRRSRPVPLSLLLRFHARHREVTAARIATRGSSGSTRSSTRSSSGSNSGSSSSGGGACACLAVARCVCALPRLRHAWRSNAKPTCACVAAAVTAACTGTCIAAAAIVSVACGASVGVCVARHTSRLVGTRAHVGQRGRQSVTIPDTRSAAARGKPRRYASTCACPSTWAATKAKAKR